MNPIKKHGSTIVVALVVSSLAAVTPVIAHGVEHALFAHEAGVARDANKLGGTAPGGYVKNKGEILVTMSHKEWRAPSGVTISADNYESTHYERANAGQAAFTAIPTIPEVLYGKRLRLEGVEICVDATDPGVSYEYVEIQTYINEDENFFTGPVADDHGDLFTIDTEECHVYPFSTPVLLGPGEMNGVYLLVSAEWSSGGADFKLGRATLILEPTKRTAPEVIP